MFHIGIAVDRTLCGVHLTNINGYWYMTNKQLSCCCDSRLYCVYDRLRKLITAWFLF